MEELPMDGDWVKHMMKHPYIVSAKSVETRMKVVWNQIIVDMLLDDDMDQSKKVMSLNFIDKTRRKLLLKASKEGTDKEVVEEFKRRTALGKLKLLFRDVKSGMNKQRKHAMAWQ